MLSNMLLTLADIGMRYPGTEALAGLSFEARAEETLALLGPSGCGKSTALRLVAGLEAPTAGKIAWPGIEGGTPSPGEIGFVFQEPTLLPWASVEGNIALPLRLLKRTRHDSRETVRRLIEDVGLAGFAGALPRALSGGMRMRVSLARALASEPSILLLDEPFAALDEITRQGLNDALLALKAARPLTTLFVTHSVFEAVYLANRVLVFSPRPGRVVRDMRIEAPENRAGFRFTSAYSEQCRAVSAALAEAMEARHAA